MNPKQQAFLQKAIELITEAIEESTETGNTAERQLGHKRIGSHTVQVTILAECDKGFSAPIGSHASSQLPQPQEAPKTTHRNHRQTSRWQKRVF